MKLNFSFKKLFFCLVIFCYVSLIGFFAAFVMNQTNYKIINGEKSIFSYFLVGFLFVTALFMFKQIAMLAVDVKNKIINKGDFK